MARAGVFERVAVDDGVVPVEAALPGGLPEAIEADGRHHQHVAAEQDGRTVRWRAPVNSTRPIRLARSSHGFAHCVRPLAPRLSDFTGRARPASRLRDRAAGASRADRVRSRVKRTRSCRRNAPSFQNSISSGMMRKPDQSAGAATGLVAERLACSVSTRSIRHRICAPAGGTACEAWAPSCVTRARVAK